MWQSTSQVSNEPRPRVAIIMDGNGRWATSRGLARVEGHRAGAAAVARAVEAALGLGLEWLTLFAFSADNWERPRPEVAALMGEFEGYLRREKDWFVAAGVRTRVIGRRDRLPFTLLQAIEAVEEATARGRNMHLGIAIDYSGRDAILKAARLLRAHQPAREETFSRLLAAATHNARPVPEIDLLIRTGGEQRLSDLPLWEIAYAELYFTPRMWPDFTAADLEEALRAFHSRQRRFGRIPEAAKVGAPGPR